jgi:pimeloyl-ACP methyl ester carboxylesterase
MAAEPAPTKVTAPDGTELSVHVSGRGRPLVAVHGTSSYHATWHQVRVLLDPHVRLYAMDRRGRGASGDGPQYSVAREYADVAAVVDAAARETGQSVDLLGHSYGGNIALGAAVLTNQLRRLVLYEGWPPPNQAHRATDPGLIARLDDLLEQRDPEEALLLFLRDVVKMVPEEIDVVRASPSWPGRLSAAGTVPRELRAFAASPFDPHQAARVTVPVLLLVGDQSPDDVKADPDIVAAALPDARVRVLPGQGHMAHLTAPAILAAELLAFLGE